MASSSQVDARPVFVADEPLPGGDELPGLLLVLLGVVDGDRAVMAFAFQKLAEGGAGGDGLGESGCGVPPQFFRGSEAGRLSHFIRLISFFDRVPQP